MNERVFRFKVDPIKIEAKLVIEIKSDANEIRRQAERLDQAGVELAKTVAENSPEQAKP